MAASALSLNEAMQISDQLSPADQLRLISLLSECLRQKMETEGGLVEQSPDIQVLAEQQNVQPVTDFGALLGGWPDDEPIDDFLTAVREWRQQNLAEVTIE